jgi:hypothetical protein
MQHGRVTRVWPTALRIGAAAIMAILVAGGTNSPVFQIAHGQALSGRELHVSPAGAPGNDGSAQRPLDLATALSKSSPARAGDIIWLHQGIYRGAFTSYLTGTAAAPIIVRQFPGQRATIDSGTSAFDALSVLGGHTWFWGFEITSSDTKRISAQPGSWPSDLLRGYGAVSRAPGIKFINMIVHDNANGIGLWSESVGSEAYGNVVYYNGWQAPDRAHGHGIYTQNAAGLRLIAENILLHQFSHGIHAYGSGVASLDNITLEGNISSMNGSISRGGIYESGRDLLLGGYRVASNPVLASNSTYGGQTNLGYSAGCSNARVTDNYFAGPFLLINCVPAMSGNHLWDLTWPKYGTLPTQYPQNTFYTTQPTSTFIRVRPNKYETGRAHIAVYNWGSTSVLPVDISAARLPIGTAFEIRDAQNYFGTPVVTGTYDGRPVNLVMSGLRAAAAVGNVPVAPSHTAPKFAAFVVVSKSTAPPTTPPPPNSSDPSITLTASSTSLTKGQSATLSWSAANASSVSIEPGIGTVAMNGTRSVTPTTTTTYTAASVNSAGKKTISAVTLTVADTTPPAPPKPPAPPTGTGGVTAQMTSPVNNSWAPNQSTVTVSANVSDPSGVVTRVEFYRGPTNIGTRFKAPYTLQWSHVTTGTWAVTARVYTKSGAIVISAPTVLNVPR